MGQSLVYPGLIEKDRQTCLIVLGRRNADILEIKLQSAK